MIHSKNTIGKKPSKTRIEISVTSICEEGDDDRHHPKSKKREVNALSFYA